MSLAFLCLFISACSDKSARESYCLNDGDKVLLLPGDIIMRRGHGMLSSVIVRSVNDTIGVSHCGIIVRSNDSINVIHCLADELSGTDGIQKCTLDEFTDESVPGSIFVVRCNSHSGDFLANAAVKYLKMGKKFDWDLDTSDTTKFFCSEMPERILRDSLGITSDSSSLKNSFTQFFNPSYFKVILRNR